MTSCKDIYAFLNQVGTRQVTSTLSDSDAALLAQLNLVQFLTADDYQKARANVTALAGDRAALGQEQSARAGLAAEVQEDDERTHSVLFHLEGAAKQQAAQQKEAQDQASLKTMDADLVRRQLEIGQLVAQQTLLDTLSPYGDRYVGLTNLGSASLRDLGFAMYRVSDADFGTYWNQALKIGRDLADLAARGADYFGRVSPSFPDADRTQLWAISIGLASAQPDPAQGAASFVGVYNQIANLSPNLENRLMSAEILSAISRPLADELPLLGPLLRDVKGLAIPDESALGIASIVLLGRRADGSLATAELQSYRRLTMSYEAAALLAIDNVPVDQLIAKFQSLRGLFAGWGYQPSEDVELSSAYLATSELPVDGISTKLAIIAKGLQTYLAYPLVAAAVLASLSTLEANETLNLLEKAYDIVGRRARPMTQSELICLALRMLHGIRNELVGPLDTTAAAAPTTTAARAGYYYGPRFFFVPIIVAHQTYFSTYSGVSGAHPGHVHGFVGGGGGGGGAGGG